MAAAVIPEAVVILEADFMVVRLAVDAPPSAVAGSQADICTIIDTPTRATLTPGMGTVAPGTDTVTGTDTATGDTGMMISIIIIVFLSGSFRTGIQAGAITIGGILTTRTTGITGTTTPIITTRTTATIPAKTDPREPASKC